MSLPVGRFAPTPSGYLHPGNLMCALIAYLSVRHAGGRFLLRIEDLDKPRCPDHLIQDTLSDLTYLSIRWDEPPLYQSSRTSIYEHAFQMLRDSGVIYPCFCTRNELHAALAPHPGDTTFIYSGKCSHLTPEQVQSLSAIRKPAMRLRVPDRVFSFTDRLQGLVSQSLQEEVGDFIVRRSDGVYGYQLAVVVDDAMSGMTEIVRGRDILSSTPRQIYLQELLHLPTPAYYHVPLLSDGSGKKMSKRNQAISLRELSHRYTQPQLLGFLAYCAGLLPEYRETTMDSLISSFDWSLIRHDDFVIPPRFLQAL